MIASLYIEESLKNYTPRSLKIRTSSGLKVIKLIILILLITIIFIMIFFSNTKKNTFTLNDQVFEGEYKENKNFIKINKLKLMGYNKEGVPYQLTADSAIKETKNIDNVLLYKVKADIFLKSKNWLFLNTENAIFEINSKTLHANKKVQGFYDDGSSFSAPSMKYNFDTGIVQSKEGIVMLGKWGNITADRFSFNSIRDIYRFEGKAVMVIK